MRRGPGKGCPLVPDVRLETAATARALANDECGAQRRVSQRPVHDFELACGSRRHGSGVISSAQRAYLGRPDPSEHHLGDANDARASRPREDRRDRLEIYLPHYSPLPGQFRNRAFSTACLAAHNPIPTTGKITRDAMPTSS